nr:glycosyltransferase [uncultured Sphingomonas sp.]
MSPAERPLATLLVLAFNQEDYIEEAVLAAFAQSYSPLEILLSDDCSTDRTFARMQALAAGYGGPHRVRLNRNAANLHIGAHIQKAAELSTGALIVVNAGDDVSEPNRVERLVSAWLSADPRPDLLHGDARRLSPEGEIGVVIKPSPLLRSNPTPMALALSGDGVMGATQAWSRTLFERFPPLGKHIHCEDRLLPFRAALGGGNLYVEEPLLRYRTGGISTDFLSDSAQDVLWGSGLKVGRWLRDGYAQMQRDLEARPDLAVDPDLHQVLAKKEALHAAPLALAAAPYDKRLRVAATILRDDRLPWRDRLRPVFMYLAPALWSWQLEAKRRQGRL